MISSGVSPVVVESNCGGNVSVCMLTYNHCHLVESSLQTVLQQTVKDLEIIVSDDCSTDGTWEKILSISAQHSCIRAIRTPRNLGMAGNANYAIKACQRPYVALLHHDDLYRKDLLEKWADVLERHKNVAFVFNSYGVYASDFVYCEDMPSELIDGKWLLEKRLFARWGCLIRGTAMIRRTTLTEIGGLREHFGMLADIDLWMRLAARWSVGYVPEPLITVRQERPAYYPSEYKGSEWSWHRQRLLYEIHAANRLEYFAGSGISSRLQWWRFRIRLSLETIKWLSYGVLRKKTVIIKTSELSVTKYDLWFLRCFRWCVRAIF
jgi:glycosyltransferase involved in cell wall biosynthesis